VILMWACGDLVIDTKFLELVVRMTVAHRRAVIYKSAGHPAGSMYLAESQNLGWVASLLAAGVQQAQKYADN